MLVNLYDRGPRAVVDDLAATLDFHLSFARLLEDLEPCVVLNFRLGLASLLNSREVSEEHGVEIDDVVLVLIELIANKEEQAPSIRNRFDSIELTNSASISTSKRLRATTPY
mmetsp:Transcript_8754/g.14846  ORF Transcript_8754/g.14846 Transcript_8754/m.14846 type:complete len:112 (-) Transcript_8754:46-381(-)